MKFWFLIVNVKIWFLIVNMRIWLLLVNMRIWLLIIFLNRFTLQVSGAIHQSKILECYRLQGKTLRIALLPGGKFVSKKHCFWQVHGLI